MSHTPSSQTVTQQQQLPSWLNQANQYGAQQAKSLYQQGGPQYYPGNTVAPLSSIQEQYLTNASNLGTQGNPTLNAGSNYAQQAAGGAYLDPSSNPYLADTFHQAAGQVQNQIMSQFGANGRNLESSIPVQSDQLGNLANKIYGGQYQNERNLQSQAAYMTPSLNQADLSNLGAVGNAGNLLQQQSQNYINGAQTAYNYNQQLPYSNLSDYMSTVNSLTAPQTQTTQKPIYHNQTAGALGGALAGSQVGSQYNKSNGGNNPYASLIGAGLGALGGYFAG